MSQQGVVPGKSPMQIAGDRLRENHVTHDFGAFQHLVTGHFMPLDLQSTARQSFWGALRQVDSRVLQLTRIEAAPHVVRRLPDNPQVVSSGVVKLNLILKGSGVLEQDERRAVLRPGDIAVSDATRPYSLTFQEDFQLVALMFDPRELNLTVSQMEQITATTISPEAGVAAVVSPFLQKLGSDLDLIAGHQGEQIATSTLDLVRAVLIQHLGVTAIRRDQRSELVAKILASIDAHLSDPLLSPRQVAEEHFISVRYLHEIFKEEGFTVSRHIKRRRLQLCHQDLLDPLLGNYSVGAIAARRGFVDAAHFSRIFRAEFGISPSDVRAEGLVVNGASA